MKMLTDEDTAVIARAAGDINNAAQIALLMQSEFTDPVDTIKGLDDIHRLLHGAGEALAPFTRT